MSQLGEQFLGLLLGLARTLGHLDRQAPRRELPLRFRTCRRLGCGLLHVGLGQSQLQREPVGIFLLIRPLLLQSRFGFFDRQGRLLQIGVQPAIDGVAQRLGLQRPQGRLVVAQFQQFLVERQSALRIAQLPAAASLKEHGGQSGHASPVLLGHDPKGFLRRLQSLACRLAVGRMGLGQLKLDHRRHELGLDVFRAELVALFDQFRVAIVRKCFGQLLQPAAELFLILLKHLAGAAEQIAGLLHQGVAFGRIDTGPLGLEGGDASPLQEDLPELCVGGQQQRMVGLLAAKPFELDLGSVKVLGLARDFALSQCRLHQGDTLFVSQRLLPVRGNQRTLCQAVQVVDRLIVVPPFTQGRQKRLDRLARLPRRHHGGQARRQHQRDCRAGSSSIGSGCFWRRASCRTSGT